MHKWIFIAVALFMMGWDGASAQECISCHELKTPGIVRDWELSRHAQNDVDCVTCHGEAHSGIDDVHEARIPTPAVCAPCHETQVTQYSKGKHALAWTASKAMPTAHAQPMAMMSGMKGCNGCHKIGLKSEEDIATLKSEGQGYGLASCDACHTRHTFSKTEAQQPQACKTCHMGFDHAQWEMYSSSKHGVRALLRQNGTLHSETSAPTCQDCHMAKGNHEVRTSWGFFGIRLPMPDDNAWAADRAAIMQALGMLDMLGNPTTRVINLRKYDVMRLTESAWQIERDRMIRNCENCHSGRFAEKELEKGDQMIREADRLMAQAIRTVAALYRDGILTMPDSYEEPFPDLLSFHDAPTTIELRLFEMFYKHRMRAFQGTFHNSPNHALWDGWSALVRDLTEIRSMAAELRDKAGGR